MTQKKIDTVLSTEYYHVFYRGKELKQLMQKTIPKVQKAIKEHVNPPKTNKKVYLVSIKYKPDSEKKKLIINCSQNTITPKLNFSMDNNDDSFSIIYSEKEYKKYKFELEHIKKIINKIKKDELDVSVQFINISEILE
jgi:hypothetical protein